VLVDDSRVDAKSNERRNAETVEQWKQWAPNLVWSKGAGNHMTTLDKQHVATLASYLVDDARRAT
jgi:thioesterase domain-containing protein